MNANLCDSIYDVLSTVTKCLKWHTRWTEVNHKWNLGEFYEIVRQELLHTPLFVFEYNFSISVHNWECIEVEQKKSLLALKFLPISDIDIGLVDI